MRVVTAALFYALITFTYCTPVEGDLRGIPFDAVVPLAPLLSALSPPPPSLSFAVSTPAVWNRQGSCAAVRDAADLRGGCPT